MNSDTIRKILHLNNKFYCEVADEFHRTRNMPWAGWSSLISKLESTFEKNVKVLDIGCGNGRFIDILKDSKLNYNYTGIDNNETLLKYASQNYQESNINFLNLDVFNELEKINSKYDLVLLFGITHHIPSREARVKWFKDITKLINHDGLFIFTIWNIQNDRRGEKLQDKIDEFEPSELEYGDKFYGWSDKNVYRYVHVYTDDEIDEIITALNSEDIHLIEKFNNDGGNLNLNTYFVMQKK